MKDGMCDHSNFRALAGIHRLTNDENVVHAWMCDLRVQCCDCELEFTFPGFSNGISSHEARVSIDGKVLSVPIKPSNQEAFSFFPGFNVRHLPE
jgi:hypothetical protein